MGGVIEEPHPDAVDLADLRRIVLLLAAGRADVIHAPGVAGVQLGDHAVIIAVQGVVVGHGQHIHAAVQQRIHQLNGR